MAEPTIINRMCAKLMERIDHRRRPMCGGDSWQPKQEAERDG